MPEIAAKELPATRRVERIVAALLHQVVGWAHMSLCLLVLAPVWVSRKTTLIFAFSGSAAVSAPVRMPLKFWLCCFALFTMFLV